MKIHFISTIVAEQRLVIGSNTEVGAILPERAEGEVSGQACFDYFIFCSAILIGGFYGYIQSLYSHISD
jgi:hypothetical protein